MAQSMRLIVSIVEQGHGAAMQKLYNTRQVFLHLQCAGRGTATSEIMDILGLGSSEKDVVLSFAPGGACHSLLREHRHGRHCLFPAGKRTEQPGRRPGALQGGGNKTKRRG